MPLVSSGNFSTHAVQLHALQRSSGCGLPVPEKRGFRPRRTRGPQSADQFSVLCCRNGGARATNESCLGHLRKLWLVSTSSASRGGCQLWNLPSSGDTGGPVVTVGVALRRIWELVADDRLVVYIAFGSLTIAAISEITVPSILAASVFAAQNGNTVAFYGYVRVLVVLSCISGICSGLRSGCFALANVTLVKRLRETLYSTLIFQDISFFDAEAVGDLTSRLGADCQRMSHVLSNDLHLIFRNILQGTGALINLLSLSWPLTLSTLVICAVLAAIFLVYGRYQKNAAKLSQDFTAGANQVAEDTLSQMRTVHVYGTERVEIRRYKKWLERLASVGILESSAYGLWNLSFIVLYRSTQVFALMLGGTSVITGHVSSEQLTKYVLYCEWMIYATWRLVDSLSSLMQSIGASERVFQLMSISPGDQYSLKGLKLQRLMGHIEFLNVSFCYPSRIMVPVLQDVNLLIQPKELVAIVGLSGCGKSSLVNLLLRLYKPAHGQLYLDNYPLDKLDVRWLRSKIGYVGQGPYLFHMDVKSNISYGSLRYVTQEDIEWAAKEAGAHEFISSLPNGYETIVHEGLLSGGQKQRIAIARAILRDPDILILDEATSALDMENEHQVKALIDGLRNDARSRTIIVVAHRPVAMERADRIIVMNGGKVVEVGTHSELLQRNGIYARLFKLQTDWLG
ncbi:ABC transporter B family member 26, chloroplastic-like [Punica granatum]|uniref:ABC transporter B family member 26, chloroplastic-like n=1 Tax=Punica granatum TaxID=22663 RepID=A0A6P8CDU2_PUNGR|nr:ABC transporter B family member 26, chloroplastic-like [Punica granatum]